LLTVTQAGQADNLLLGLLGGEFGMSQVGAVVARLRGVGLFASFEDEALEVVAGIVRSRKYNAGEVIFLRGDRAESMFIVDTGQVRLSIISAEGREITLRHVGSGAAFGEIALLDGGLRTATAVANRAATLMVIPRAPFQLIVDERPAVAGAVIRFLCARLRDTTDQLEAIALMPLEQRLARLFLQFAAARGPGKRVVLPLDLSQGELATLVAASRPKVNQILVGWDAEGIVQRGSEGLVIDAESLRAIAEGDEG
jgi:CRP-like cAMP-binding protein